VTIIILDKSVFIIIVIMKKNVSDYAFGILKSFLNSDGQQFH